MEIPPDSKVNVVNMGPNWGRQDPGGPHVGPMNLTIRAYTGETAFLFSIIPQYIALTGMQWVVDREHFGDKWPLCSGLKFQWPFLFPRWVEFLSVAESEFLPKL